MKIKTNEANELIAKKLGIQPYEKFNIKYSTDNPYFFDDDYKLFDSHFEVNITNTLIEKEIIKSPCFQNREEMHEKLKKLANGFKPNWSDGDQSKTSIVYSHSDRRCTTINSHSYQHSLDTVYFESREAAQRAITFFTDEEWQMYFGVEE